MSKYNFPFSSVICDVNPASLQILASTSPTSRPSQVVPNRLLSDLEQTAVARTRKDSIVTLDTLRLVESHKFILELIAVVKGLTTYFILGASELEAKRKKYGSGRLNQSVKGKTRRRVAGLQKVYCSNKLRNVRVTLWPFARTNETN